MGEVEVAVRRIEWAKFSETTRMDSITFDVGASLTERGRNSDSLDIGFEISVETQPPLAKILLAGVAKISGESEEIQTLVTTNDQSSAPPVFMKIYEKIYPIMYLLSGSLSIPHPAPGLLKTTHLYSAKEIAQPVEMRRNP